MSRVQLALNVDDLEAVDRLLHRASSAPSRPRSSPATPTSPSPSRPLKLVLIENPGHGGSLNHLGVEVADTDTVDAEQRRLAEAGLASIEERDTTCCYARQDKFWVEGAPNGEQWEIYTVLEDTETFGPGRPRTDHTMTDSPESSASCDCPLLRLARRPGTRRTQKYADRALDVQVMCIECPVGVVRRASSARSAECQRRPIPARCSSRAPIIANGAKPISTATAESFGRSHGTNIRPAKPATKIARFHQASDPGPGQSDQQQDRADERDHLEPVPEEQQRGVLEAAEHLGRLLDRQVLRGREVPPVAEQHARDVGEPERREQRRRSRSAGCPSAPAAATRRRARRGR